MGTEEGWGCPERQIGPAGLKHDMFSLGLVIYFCITGSHPYGNIDNLYECQGWPRTRASRPTSLGLQILGASNFFSSPTYKILVK
jgi:serine/threonine protein kinase